MVDNPKTWSFRIPGVQVVPSRDYLTGLNFNEPRQVKVFNLCRSYRYQSTGYYVSLLAMARGHKVLPSITTIQDMKSLTITRIVGEDLDELTQKTLKPIESNTFTLSIYFGRNLAKRYSLLSSRLFGLFQAPLLRAQFQRDDGEWLIRSIRPITPGEIPPSHVDFVTEAASAFFAKNRLPANRTVRDLYHLAILTNPSEATPPSDRAALKRFAAAARRRRIDVEFITRDDFGRVAEFEALFIRETTSVHHHTYRFARRAAAEGVVVIDDPDSITRCSNKVYLAELLTRYNIPHPLTLILHRDNRERILDEIGLPCILKRPDSSFSQGVVKAESIEAFDKHLDHLLERSDLVIAQEFVPTAFDWRIGLLDRQPLYACKYHMVDEHWQIAREDGTSRKEGRAHAVTLDSVPPAVLSAAVRAARPIGDGLYGVDVKEVLGKVMVIEINDNPNIDAGIEDGVLGDELYDRIMQFFLTRIEKRRNGIGKDSA